MGRRFTRRPSPRLTHIMPTTGITAGLVVIAFAAGCAGHPKAKGPGRRASPAGHAAAPDERVVTFERARIHVEIDLDENPLSWSQTAAWVTRSAQMLSHYFGRFSVPSLKVELPVGGRHGLSHGQHYGGRRIVVFVGRNTDVRDVEQDWVMVHEMMHTAFPRVQRRHRWMREGLSTYLESVVRAEAGVIPAAAVWGRWRRQMPYGVPAPDDAGLDNDRSWGALYWGGALFWLMADVAIREQSGGRAALHDVMRAILKRGGNGLVTWSPQRIVQLGDEATGTRVLSRLYAAHGQRRGDVDLDAFFDRLGVREDGTIDAAAPGPRISRAMYRPIYALAPVPAG